MPHLSRALLKLLSPSFFLATLLLGQYQALCEPYKIGVSLPLTGANEAPGQDIRRGFELGKEILGLADVQFVFEDDACDGARSVSAIKKLIEVDKVNLVSGIYCNTALIPAAPLLNRAKTPVLTVGATTGDQTGIGERIFRIFPADHLAVTPLIPEMTKRGDRLCVVTETDAYSTLIERTLSREWSKQGGTLHIESVNVGERDFRTTILRLMRRGCDSILLNTCGDDGFIAAYKQLKVVNKDLPVFAIYYPGSSTVQKALGETLKGLVYADLASQSALTTPLGETFIKLYQARHGQFLIAQPIALLAFEALRVIALAHKEGVSLEQFIRRGPIRDGAISEYSFDSDGAVQGINFQVLTYR